MGRLCGHLRLGLAVKVSRPINSVYHEKGRGETVASWRQLLQICAGGPHLRETGTARGDDSITSITEGEGGTRITKDGRGEVGGMMG